MTKIDSEYDHYFNNLIKGKRNPCSEILDSLIAREFNVHNIYEDLFQKGLYQVGRMWEQNKISVATEHLATSITENLMNRVYEKIPIGEAAQKKVVITSIENETHRIGGKMVADIFEMQGWEAIYLGGDTPAAELVDFVEQTEPDLVGLSVSVYFHMDTLVKTIDMLNKKFKTLPIMIGGQAFQRGGHSIIGRFENTSLILSLDSLETSIIDINKGVTHL
jgi:methanogenic corrinoid protein MtbC1